MVSNPLYLVILCAVLHSGYAAEFRAERFGAKGDGRVENAAGNRAAIQGAIDVASRSHGTVVFGPGVYVTGALFLQSGTGMRIDEGVEIRGVQNLSAYPQMQTRIAGVEMKWPSALINVCNQSDVKVFGKGVVDGDGKVWWDKYWRMRREDYEPRGLRWAVDYDCQRPRLIQVYKSTKVLIQGLTLKRPGFWTVHICYSQRVTVDGVTIRNNTDGRGPSTDGIDVDSSRNVMVRKCDIDCNDDAICLKAGRDADGLRVNRPTEKVVIRDCTVRGGAAGFTIGSETSGGIRDVRVSRLHVLGPVPTGLLFKSASTRGGTMERITIDNVDMRRVSTPVSVSLNWNPSYSYGHIPENVKNPPDYWRVLTQPVPAAQGLPHFRGIHISRVKAIGAEKAFAVSSYQDAPLCDFRFELIEIQAKSAGSISNAEHWTFKRTRIQTSDGSVPSLTNSRDVVGLSEARPGR